MTLSSKKFNFCHGVTFGWQVHTLESGIDVQVGINVQVGIFFKNNKRAVWNKRIGGNGLK